MILRDESIDRRLRGSLRQSLSVALRAAPLPSHADLVHVSDAVGRGALARATRDLDRIWRCHPDDSMALAPIYGRLLALSSSDHYATLRLLQHAVGHCPDADLAALIPLSYLRLERIDDAQLQLQQALSDYCTSPGSLLSSVASVFVQHNLNTPGWVGRGPRLELNGQLSAQTQGREIEIRSGSRVSPARVEAPVGGRRLFKFSPAESMRAKTYEVLCNGVPLLGSNARTPENFNLDGRTSSSEEKLTGWARVGWHPKRQVRVTAEDVFGERTEGATRRWPDHNGRWQFEFDLSALQGDRFSVLVRLPDGRWEPLADSPLLLESAMRLPGRRPRRLPPRGAHDSEPHLGNLTSHSSQITTIVIPVYRGREEALACIESVLTTVDRAVQILVVDDATEDKQLRADLDALATGGHITLLRNESNFGFVASVNRAAEHCPNHDLVLLNSDTVVFADWLARLRAAAYSDLKVGTATPLSNNGSIASYPRTFGATIDPKEGAGLHDLAASINSDVRLAIPVGVGFCLFIRRDCLQAVGNLDVAAFGKGYGEETDFCMRARLQGWSHCLAADVFVYHAGGSSFAGRRAALLDRSQRLINFRYPGFDAFIQSFQEFNPLHRIRRALDQERLRRFQGQFVLIATLALSGGVERFVTERCENLRKKGFHPLVLRASKPGHSDRCELWTDAIEVPNLAYEIPDDLADLDSLLHSLNIIQIDIQHFLDLDARVIEMLRGLKPPYEVYVHDYTWICPRVTLIDGSQRYCGEPEVTVCQQCVRIHGSSLSSPKSVRALRARSKRWLSAASRVIAPSNDTAERLQRYFPSVNIQVRPHTARIPISPLQPRAPHDHYRVAIIGAIGEHKGYDVILDCARDAQIRRLPLEFILIGHSQDDAPLLATGKVFITGRYSESEAQHLIAREQPDVAWFPSVWPETWCYALDHAIGARLSLAAFDIGAIAERIRACGGGLLLPLELEASEINDRLLEGNSTIQSQSLWPIRRSTIKMPIGRTEGAEMNEKSRNDSSQSQDKALDASVQILPLPAGLYLFSVKAATPFRVTNAGYLTLPAVHVGLGPGARPEQVEFVTGPSTQGAWLFAVGDQLVAKIQGTGVTLVLTSVRAPGGEVLAISVERLDARATEAAQVSLAAVSEESPERADQPAPIKSLAIDTEKLSVPLRIGVHVRARGDLNFSDASWAGRVAPGLWIESFSVLPIAQFRASDIEYKGLTGSGFETPWLSDEKVCGTKGMAVPLVGFAIRLKPNQTPAAAEYDCEYSGYFQSGQTIGPLRNGTPCRSTVANDPLEGLQIRIVKRLATGRHAEELSQHANQEL